MKYLRPIAKWLALFALTTVLAHLLLAIIYDYPRKSFETNNKKNPLSVDCNAVQIGMDLPTALKILTRHGEPTFESFEGNVLTVRRGHTESRISFDSATQRVTRTESREMPYFDERYM